jgi:hypothetical protein
MKHTVNRHGLPKIAICIATLFAATHINASPVTIGFESVIEGQNSFLFDANNDGITDAIFSTGDAQGFNISGPGPNQLFVDEPGLEGGTGSTPDLRVDLLTGGIDSISFGFATLFQTSGVAQVFNASNEQIASTAFAGAFFNLDTGEEVDEFGGIDANISGFSEGLVELPFDGNAAYVTIDFNDEVFGEEFEGPFPVALNDSEEGFDDEFPRPPIDEVPPLESFGRYFVDNFTYTIAGDETLEIFEGADPEFPILPDPFDPENPEFRFELDIIEDGLGTRFPIFIDPIIAVGYEYAVTNGPNVKTVLVPDALPNGDSEFVLNFGQLSFAIEAGIPFDITSISGFENGVSEFSITEISTAEALEPTDTLAFNTGLTFVSAGAVDVTQTPITIDTDANAIPTPGLAFLFSASFFGLFLSRRKR